MRMASRLGGVLGVLAAAFAALGQGLEPPAGPVAPTMKPLLEVEPRVAVNGVNTPGDKGAVFVITRPGSYYLTGAVAGEAGKAGIEIAASHVTLDLSGFEVKGVEKATSGVRVRDEQTNVCVRNGSLHAWPIAGVDMQFALTSVVEDVRSVENGVGVLASANASVRRCVATHNVGGGGILGGRSVTVEDCVTSFNTGVGIYVLETSRVLRCTFENNTTDGLYLDGSGCIVTQCIGVTNGRHGIAVIYGAAITDCTMEHNGGDGMWSIAPVQFERCRATFNVRDGIEAWDGSTVTKCSLRENGEDGIEAGGRVVVSECQAIGQVHGAGIRVTGMGTRVEGNTVTGNSIGVSVEGTGCLVVRNGAAGNLKSAFDIGPGNAFGPIVNVGGVGDVGSAVGAGHPLANLVY